MAGTLARRCAHVASVLAVVATLSAQQTSPEADAEFATLLAAARQSFAGSDWDRRTATYQALIAAARAKGSALWEGRGILGLARIANETARYPDARKLGLEALAIFERLELESDIGDASAFLGRAADLVNDFTAATTHYERAATRVRRGWQRRGRIPRAS